MKEVTAAQAKHMTAPCPVANMCTRKDDGTTNLAPISFYTFLSLKHGIICFEAGKGKHTTQRLLKTGEGAITIPGEAIAEQTMACGKCSGKDVDKAAKYGIEMMPVEGFDVQIPVHSRVALMCRLQDTYDIGEDCGYLFICKIEKALVDESEKAVFDIAGNASKLGPVEG